MGCERYGNRQGWSQDDMPVEIDIADRTLLAG
jgi:hypothetical protein